MTETIQYALPDQGGALPDRREFKLDGIAPWGRRLDEYRAFFALDDVPRGTQILDIGGGPASFASEAVSAGYDVTAVDPIYAFDGQGIRSRFEATSKAMRAGFRAAAYRFNWSFYGSESLVHRRRLEALEWFLADFAHAGSRRYVAAALPHLTFGDRAFDLALISHLLFLYGDELDGTFHLAALREALRVAREVRVFPLLNLDGRPSSHLPGVIRALESDGYVVALQAVDFEFQRGATKMLRVRHG